MLSCHCPRAVVMVCLRCTSWSKARVSQWSDRVWLAAAGHFLILAASFQVPYRLGWEKDLRSLMPFNRKLLWVQSAFTVLTITAFGVLTLALHAGRKAARSSSDISC
jgi:hypothetical protein